MKKKERKREWKGRKVREKKKNFLRKFFHTHIPVNNLKALFFPVILNLLFFIFTKFIGTSYTYIVTTFVIWNLYLYTIYPKSFFPQLPRLPSTPFPLIFKTFCILSFFHRFFSFAVLRFTLLSSYFPFF